MASIRCKDEKVGCSLGNYATEEDAALGYDIMALALFGAEVRTNFDGDVYGAFWYAEWMKVIGGGFASQFDHDRRESRAALRVLVSKLKPRLLRSL